MTAAPDPEPGIIQPRRLRGEPAVGRDALLVLTAGELPALATALGARQVSLRDAALRRIFVLPAAGGAAISLAGPCLGAPQAVMALEKLIVLGAGRIWVFGWCGSLQPEVRIGDIFLPTSALSEEGTSAHYPLRGRIPGPDPGITARLRRRVRSSGMPFHEGRIWSTDAPYRETPRKVRLFRAQGVGAVDMEMSALMTVAAYRQVPLGAMLVVSDELSDAGWNPGFSSERLRQASRRALGVLADAVLGATPFACLER